VRFVVFCSKCGQELPDKAYFCPKCGVRTEKGAEAGVSAPIDDLREAFVKAGREIEKAFQTAAEEVQKTFRFSGEDIKESENQQPATCSKCGRKNSSDANFCYDCGKKL
jgi:predicted amidophosphoribosyltransferase